MTRVDWRPLEPADLAPALVLSYDQSLRNTGWCLLAADEGPDEGDPTIAVRVLACGTIRTKSAGDKGWYTTLAQYDELLPMVQSEMGALSLRLGEIVREFWVLHEMPSTAGFRPESSVLAAAAVRTSAARVRWADRLAMIGSQSGKALVANNAKASKTEITEGLAKLPWIEGLDRLRNEHDRDALANGLAFLHHLKRDRDKAARASAREAKRAARGK